MIFGSFESKDSQEYVEPKTVKIKAILKTPKN
jgi:hypothetical protein